MIRNSILWILIACVGSAYQAFSQQAGILVKNQRRFGNYENVSLDSDTLRFEQRLYRNPFVGIYEIKSAVADSTLKNFSPLFQGIPIATYTMKAELEVSQVQHPHSFRFFPFLQKNYKLDFSIQPLFSAIFGDFNKPVKSNTAIALNTQLYLWKGMALNFGILFPITNDLDRRPKNIRPAPIYLNQFLASGKHYFSGSLGYFYNDYYGFNIQYRYSDLSRPWSFGFEGGLVGLYFFESGRLSYDNLEYPLAVADVAYRLKSPDLTFKISGGRFIAGDYGGRFDLYRQFSNIEIGLFATTTTNGSNVGFNFTIPIPPGKLLQGTKVRLRTTNEYNFEYSYSRGYRIAQRYRVGYQLDQRLRQHHQYYLNRQYQKTR